MALPTALINRLTLPVIGAPMFIVSNPKLVITQCQSGIVGAFPALNARTTDQLREWIIQIKTELAEFSKVNPAAKVAPFAVNQICHVSNGRLMADMQVCVEQQVPIIITSLRPPAEIVAAVHAYGGVVFHDVISIRHAKKAAAQGVDGLILVCAGAGGHAGTLSPFALLREVKSFFQGTIILSGAISDGFSIASALALGADLAYIGTRFIATKEANADDRYQKMLIDSTADDVIYTAKFTGIHGNYLKGSIIEAGYDPSHLERPERAEIDAGSVDGGPKKIWKDILGAGQGVGSIRATQPAAELIASMRQEFKQAQQALTLKANFYQD
jgi:nitronate monooxygenase